MTYGVDAMRRIILSAEVPAELAQKLFLYPL